MKFLLPFRRFFALWRSHKSELRLRGCSDPQIRTVAPGLPWHTNQNCGSVAALTLKSELRLRGCPDPQIRTVAPGLP